MFQIFWEFAASQNKNVINDNKQANCESVIFRVMGTSTCCFLLIIYSSSIPYKATSQTDEEINSLIWLSLSRDSSISCLSFSVSVSLFICLLFPPCPSFHHIFLFFSRERFLLWFFISDTWSLHLLTPTPSCYHTQSRTSTCVCTSSESCCCFRITHPLSQEKRQRKEQSKPRKIISLKAWVKEIQRR